MVSDDGFLAAVAIVGAIAALADLFLLHLLLFHIKLSSLIRAEKIHVNQHSHTDWRNISTYTYIMERRSKEAAKLDAQLKAGPKPPRSCCRPRVRLSLTLLLSYARINCLQRNKVGPVAAEAPENDCNPQATTDVFAASRRVMHVLLIYHIQRC